jgi:hypothetical protein
VVDRLLKPSQHGTLSAHGTKIIDGCNDYPIVRMVGRGRGRPAKLDVSLQLGIEQC